MLRWAMGEWHTDMCPASNTLKPNISWQAAVIGPCQSPSHPVDSAFMFLRHQGKDSQQYLVRLLYQFNSRRRAKVLDRHQASIHRYVQRPRPSLRSCRDRLAPLQRLINKSITPLVDRVKL